MKVKMKDTHESAVDGVNIKKYKKGKTYDVPPAIAENWIRKGWAEASKKAKAVEPEETKVEGPEETK